MKNKELNGQNGRKWSRNNGAKRGGQKRIVKGVRRLAEKEWMRRAVAKVATEVWWRKSLPGQKALAMTLAQMIGELTDRKHIEVRLESGAVRVRFVHLLERPEDGCLSVIMLPETPAGVCN